MAIMDRALAVGDRQTVLRHYDELESRLRDELGVTPSPAALVLRDRALALAGPTVGTGGGMRTFLLTAIDGPSGTGPGRGRTGDGPAATGRTLHDRLVGDEVERCGGVEFRPTDGDAGAVFDSASAAVTAAVSIQRALRAADWEDDRPRVRMGLDVGVAEHRDGDWSGLVIDRAARILEAANGDQIVCSELVASLATPGLGSGIATVALGLFRLPGLAPTVLHRVDADGLERRTGLRAPPAVGPPPRPVS